MFHDKGRGGGVILNGIIVNLEEKEGSNMGQIRDK